MAATRGTPLQGDRSTHDMTDADKHASDIEDSALTRHLPAPAADGNFARDDGSNWQAQVGIDLDDLNDYARGSIIRGGAADWEAYATETDAQILVGDGTDLVSVAVSNDVALSNTGAMDVVSLSLPDTDDSNDLDFIWNEDDSSDRIINWLVNGANRTVTLQGDLTVESASLLDQDLTSDASPTFAGVTLGNTGLHLLDTNASHDLIVAPGSDLTADRTLTLTTGDADREVTLGGDLTVAETMSAAGRDVANTFTAAQTINGSADTEQLIIEANGTQSNTNPLVLLRDSTGAELVRIHSDDDTNLFVGTSAGEDNTVTGTGNAGLYNSFVGSNAGANNTTGFSNSFFGRDSGISNTTGNSNSFFGKDSGRSNTTGFYNSFFGLYSGRSNTTGYSNSFFGISSGYDVTEGLSNTILGNNTGRGITTGDYNTIVGANVLGLAADLSNTVIVSDGNGNIRIYVDSDGNVGIGTDSPGGALQIAQSDGTHTDLIIGAGNGGVDVGRAAVLRKDSESSPFNFDFYWSNHPTVEVGNLNFHSSQDSGELVTFTNNGNVGIGATDPDAQLDIDQSSATGAQPALKLNQGDASEEAILVSYDGSDVDMDVIKLDVTGAPVFGWDESADAFSYTHDLVAIRATTTSNRLAGALTWEWDDDTDATRAAVGKLYAEDYGASREVIAWGANGTAATLGFYAATPVTQQDVTGARDDAEAALANLLSALDSLGLITDSTTAT